MSLIEGGQLSVVHQIFETPPTELGAAELDLKNISQVLNVVPEIRRRSAPIAGIDGFFTGILENSHAGADDEDSAIDPYNVGDSALGNFPAVVAEGSDIWLLVLTGYRSSGTGGITGLATLETPNFVQGFGQDDTGAAIGLNPTALNLGIITGIDTSAGVTNDPMTFLDEPGGSLLRVRIRVPRGSTLGFASRSSAAADFRLIFVMGIFPIAMGQDVLG